MKPYEYRVTVLCEDNSQVRFGATSFGIGDKLARKLVTAWPFAIKTHLSIEGGTSAPLRTYERTNVPERPIMALIVDSRRQAE